jgi:translation initiation factor RLI1
MTLISQLQNYWNKLFSRRYKVGDKVEFIQKIDSIPNRFKGTIEEINELHTFPYTIKLSDSFSHNGYTVSYINIDKKQIL